MEPWLRVEFHCHSIYSPDSLNTPQALVREARRKGIDRLIITDHNSTGGALAAQALDPRRIIVGEEIKTSSGELLTAFVKEEIPRGLPPLEAIERLRRQGAFISVSHPFDLSRDGWPMQDMMQIMPHVDAIEVFNSRCNSAYINDQAARFAAQYNLAGTVGSDAHSLIELGRSTLLLPPFSTGDELRAAIRQGQPRTRLSHPMVHLTSVFARIYKGFRPFTPAEVRERG
jgi:predicted metal-dependent phosphoesterase TrpH